MVFRAVLEACFRHGECRIRKDNAPANFTTVKHMASHLLRLATGKDSLRAKRNRRDGSQIGCAEAARRRRRQMGGSARRRARRLVSRPVSFWH